MVTSIYCRILVLSSLRYFEDTIGRLSSYKVIRKILWLWIIYKFSSFSHSFGRMTHVSSDLWFLSYINNRSGPICTFKQTCWLVSKLLCPH